jgi:hypothetical protein
MRAGGSTLAVFVAVVVCAAIGAGSALADIGNGGGDAATLAKTTASTVANAQANATSTCNRATEQARERDVVAARLAKAQANPRTTPAQLAALQADLDARTATAASYAAACALAQDNATKEAASLAGIDEGPATDEGAPTLPEVHQGAANIVKSDNMEWLSNSRGINGACSGANFIHYQKLNYDFLFCDGTGGLNVWSLKDPEHPLFSASIPTAQLVEPIDEHSHGVADTAARYWEGENMTVDSARKLVFMARDPRSFGNNNHPNGRSGLYIVDVKDPWHPRVLDYVWVPAGHTATCINDCRYLWVQGPANNGSHVSGQPQDIAGVLHPEWRGVPIYVVDVRDPSHPYVYAQPVDLKRDNNTTDYTHSTDVDQDGIAWTSGFGGVRGFYTRGFHHDVTTNTDRYATATDPIPYAGGSMHSNDPVFATNILEHNSFHFTQARSDHTSPTVTSASTGETFRKTDLQFVTQENVVNCTTSSGGGSGLFNIVDLAGSYDGQDWDPALSYASNRFYLRTISTYSAKNNPGALATGSCSAHWFTVLGNMVAIAFYAQGVRVLDTSDPASIQQVGYARIPSVSGGVQTAQNTSAAYWHDGYIYTADYSRGVDVFKFTGDIKGFVQPKVCWNVCDK